MAGRLATAAVVTCLVGTVVVAGAGLRLAAPLLAHPGRQAALDALADPSSPGLGVGTAVRTSFGALKVTEVALGNGLSDSDLGGMSHGVSRLVSVGSAQVNVVVTLSNATGHAVRIGPREFAVRSGRGSAPTGAPVAATGTTLQGGDLPSGASVDARLVFVAPTDGTKLWLQFTEPGRPVPVRLLLGITAQIAAGAVGHQHGASPGTTSPTRVTPAPSG